MPRGLGGRLALTVVSAAALWAAGTRLLLPGIDRDVVTRLDAYGGADASVTSSLGVFALGVMPFLYAYVLVELAALAVPGWRRLRYEAPEGRAKLERAARVVGLALAVVQAFFMAQYLTALFSANPFVAPAQIGTLYTAMWTASLVGGSCVALLVATLITRQGIVNGLLLLPAMGIVSAIARGVVAAHHQGTVADSWGPLHAVLLAGAIALATFAGWFALRGAHGPRETASVGVGEAARDGEGPYRAAQAFVVRAWVPVPSSSIVAVTVGVYFTSSLAVHAVVTAALAYALTRLLHRPAETMELTRRLGASATPGAEAGVLAAQRAALGPTLLFFAALLVAQRVAGMVPGFTASVVLVPIVVALAMDAWAAFAAGDRVEAVAEERRPGAVAIVRALLTSDGVQARVGGAATNALFQIFAPYAPASILVPAAQAERARGILRYRLHGEGAPPEGAAQAPAVTVEPAAARRSPRRRAVALGAVLFAAGALLSVGVIARSAQHDEPVAAARLEIVRIDSFFDPFGDVEPAGLPDGIELREEILAGGRMTYAFVALREGETPEQAIARAEPWTRTLPMPSAEARIGWELVRDFDDVGNAGKPKGIRTHVLTGEAFVTNEDVVEAVAQEDPMGGVFVSVTLTPEAAERFRVVTGEWVKRRLAIVVDGRITSAPVVQSEIGGGRLSITMGGGPPDEQLTQARTLARALGSHGR